MRKYLADANLSFQITVFYHHAYLRRSTPEQKSQKQHDSMALLTFTFCLSHLQLGKKTYKMLQKVVQLFDQKLFTKTRNNSNTF